MGNDMRLLNNTLPSDWYDIASPATLTAGGEVVLDFSQGRVQTLISTAKKSGFRIAVKAIQVVINYAVTYGAAGAGNAADVSQIQRGCFFGVQMSTPSFKQSYYKVAPTLSQMHITGRIVNPAVSVMERTSFSKFRVLPNREAVDLPGALEVGNPDVDKDGGINPAQYVGDSENFQFVRQVIAGSATFSDTFVHPLCHGSGITENDVLAIEQLADPTNPWKFTIRELTPNGVSLRTNLFNQTALTITVTARIHCQFVPMNSTRRVGVLWTSEQISFTPNFVAPAHRYVGLFLMPQFAANVTDGGVPCPYQPFNWQPFLTNPSAKSQVFQGSEQIFPLEQFDEPWRQLDHNNIGAQYGNNPMLNWQPVGATSTFIVGPGSALPGYVNPGYSTTARGAWGGVSYYPVFINLFVAKGFTPGIIQEPGCNPCLKINTLGAIPAGAENNAVIIYVNELESDLNTAKSYAVNGVANGPVGSNWIPALDNLASPDSSLAVMLVPQLQKSA